MNIESGKKSRKKYDASRKSRHGTNKNKRMMNGKISSSRKKNESTFESIWLESQKALRKKRQTKVIILFFLAMSGLTTILMKPWQLRKIHMSDISRIKKRKTFNLQNIEKSDQSHILLCKALLEMDAEYNAGHIFDKNTVIEEDRQVCLDRNNPFQSLIQLFASSLVAQAGKHLRLEYRHLCNPRDSSKSGTGSHDLYSTLQESLELILLFNTVVDKNAIKQLCKGCIQGLNKSGKKNFFTSGPECILFPPFQPSMATSTISSPIETSKNSSVPYQKNKQSSTQMFEIVLPSIIKNIYESADQYHVTHSNSAHILKKAYEDKQITTLIDPDEHDNAVIYISCANEYASKKNCVTGILPYYVYAREIPSSVQEVTIIASNACVTFSSSCFAYGPALQKFLQQWYPRASINYEIPHSTAETNSKMIRANTVICVFSTSCVLPALANSHNAILIENPNIYPWLNDLKKTFLANVRILPSSTPISTRKSLSKSFLNQDPKSRIEHCKEIRGVSGSWEKDMKYAERSQYKLPLEGYAGAADTRFQPSRGKLFREPTLYKWVEKSFPKCSIDFLNLDSLCASLDVLMIERIFILGDSLSLQMAQSLWKLLGFLDDYAGDRDSSASRRVQCPSPYHVEFELVFSRNDRLLEVETGPTGIGDKNCKYGYCWPFVQRYISSTSRTLLIANTGAHSHEHSIFYEDFDNFINLIDSLNRTDGEFVYPYIIFNIQ